MQVPTSRRIALSTLMLHHHRHGASAFSLRCVTTITSRTSGRTMTSSLSNDWIPLGLRRLEQRQTPCRSLPSSTSACISRSLSTAMAAAATSFDPKNFDPTDDAIEPLHPRQFYDANNQIPMPKALSPSAIMEFKACPQSYLFQYLFGIRQGTNEALARGTFCHSALEQVFDLEPSQRTLDNLHNLFRKSWSDERLADGYRPLFEYSDEDDMEEHHDRRDVDSEIAWGRSSLALLDNYYELEDPRSVPAPNPLAREIWVKSNFDVVNDGGDGNEKATFLVRGIVDRVDLINGPYLRIVDYKTGKCPDFKYSPEVNERIANESFFQLKIYALLLREMMKKQNELDMNGDDDNGDVNGQNNSGRRKSNGSGLPQNLRMGIPVRNLRLLYLTSKQGPAKYLDLDLGPTEEDRNAELDNIQGELVRVWNGISELVRTNDPRAFVHCDRKFCWCHKVRPKFTPETVWQRERPEQQ